MQNRQMSPEQEDNLRRYMPHLYGLPPIHITREMVMNNNKPKPKLIPTGPKKPVKPVKIPDDVEDEYDLKRILKEKPKPKVVRMFIKDIIDEFNENDQNELLEEF